MTDLGTIVQFLTRQSYILGGLFVAITFFVWLSHGKKAFLWSASLKKSAAINIGFLLFNSLLIVKLFVIAVGSFNLAFKHLNIPTIPSTFWSEWPVWAKALLIILVYDFCKYWIHRYLHGSWRWPMHAVHHSDPDLNYLSWSRGHFLELIFSACALIATTTWLGMAPKDIYLIGLIMALHQYYIHSKLDWGHGFLRYFIASPRFHRWHHVNTPEAYDKNFAEVFPFWDKIFGTYYCPGPAYDMKTGIPENPGDNFLKLIAYPFTEWIQMAKGKLSKRSVANLTETAE